MRHWGPCLICEGTGRRDGRVCGACLGQGGGYEHAPPVDEGPPSTMGWLLAGLLGVAAVLVVGAGWLL